MDHWPQLAWHQRLAMAVRCGRGSGDHAGCGCFFYLTDRPAEASWLTPQARVWIEESLRQERGSDAKPMPALEALRSLPVLVLAASYFMTNPAGYVFIFWFPTMLKRMAGVSDLRLGLAGALRFAVLF